MGSSVPVVLHKSPLVSSVETVLSTVVYSEPPFLLLVRRDVVEDQPHAPGRWVSDAVPVVLVRSPRYIRRVGEVVSGRTTYGVQGYQGPGEGNVHRSGGAEEVTGSEGV